MEPFKNMVNPTSIKIMAKVFSRVDPNFNNKQFMSLALKNLDQLELKARTLQVSHALAQCLPEDISTAAAYIVQSLNQPLDEKISGSPHNDQGIGGWSTMALAEYLGLYGQDYLKESLAALQEITRRGSAEFAIRYFLLQQPDATLKIIKKWIKHSDHHVRRLVSEGTRPRLPWGFQLPVFIQNPQPILPLLDALKDDPSEYVRRSVANNLNDIAKDHPQLVCEIAREWLIDASPERQRLVRHACRTLLKKDVPQALALFGYKKPQLEQVGLTLGAKAIFIGETIELVLHLRNSAKKQQTLMIDYQVHLVKANGQRKPKVFKWSKSIIKPNETIELRKLHSFKPVTTRKYYPGKHAFEIKINGVSMVIEEFILKAIPKAFDI